MEKQYGRTLLTNTVTNYIKVGAKLLSAVFLTRIIFLNLGNDFYGFWTLLWAIFGYSLLLDFGFGKTVQKYTAEAKFTGNQNRFNQIISAVFFSYLLMAVIICLAALLMSSDLQGLFNLDCDIHEPYFQKVFMIFGLGIALVFPTGIIPEILTGLHKIYLRNYVIVVNCVLELAGIWLILHHGGSLLAMTVFIACLNLSTNLVMSVIVWRQMPGLRLTFSGLKWSIFKEIADFSLFAYMLTMANMVIFKTDRIVLGAMVCIF
ncbi:MAG: hypothetical protein GY750_19600 [Lentisphaerae bacterium]|nr:hypothetical protein [Lentisphaerota bacterium]MCP4103603.1 hypothetical protein [Lentisphaerota bacterium]